MGPIPREQMGNATSLFNLMRNLGGSLGIATTAALIARHQQEHVNVLVAHVNPYNPQAQNTLQQLRGMFQAQGAGPVMSNNKAYAAIWGMIQRQAAILSYIDVFIILSVIFLAILPLLFLMKKPAKAAGPVAMH